ncbi:hypothetical protein [Cohnella sp. AR92]|uniref:hypothetical protein n=1 Tax=Cohnella sp. AR92 TaxID=648716 RepID=UPI000F8F3EBF|nr:hypothetical protein [Cohnella sp. AR92]RUS44923.1 hypothetical protein ELR57_21955 [Cohnella sp. AR92]
MNLRKILSRVLINKRSTDTEREIMLFVDQIKKEYSIVGPMNVKFSDELPINKGDANFGDKECIVNIGIKGKRARNREISELSESEWITLKNTIVHELRHVKNREELTQDTREKIYNNRFSLPYFAMQLIDEYDAYKSADEKYSQASIGSTESELQRAMKQWLNKQLIMLSGFNDITRYNHFYDNCTAIIVHSIRNINFPSIPETYSGYNEMCRKIIDIMHEYYSEMPLSYDKYEEAGRRLWNAILIMVPNDLINIFKKNVGIRF